ncbi:MAG: hypothetical protein ACOC04_04800 [Halothece sp.]
MRASSIIKIGIIFGLLFIWIGDVVLPKPLSEASLKTRTSINNFLVGLFPYTSPVDNPSKRTEQELKQLENNRE